MLGGVLLCGELDTQTSHAGSSLFLPWSPSSWEGTQSVSPACQEARSPCEVLLILLNKKGGRCHGNSAARQGKGQVIRRKRGPVTSARTLAPRNLWSIRASLDIHGGKERLWTHQGMASDPELILTHKLLALLTSETASELEEERSLLNCFC